MEEVKSFFIVLLIVTMNVALAVCWSMFVWGFAKGVWESIKEINDEKKEE